MGRFDWDRSAEDRPAPRPAGPSSRREQICPFGVERRQPVPCGRERNLHGRQRPALDPTVARVLADLGTFRVLAFDQIARYHYQGNLTHALTAMNHLARMGFIEYRISRPGPVTYLSLTHSGCRAVRSQDSSHRCSQPNWYGFESPHKARHDALLYGLYQEKCAEIAARNGRVTGIVLESEFVRAINRRLEKISLLTRSEQQQHKRAIAEELGLRVVNGRIPIPDLRLEYEGPDHEPGKLDLELVIEHYRRNRLACQAQAGFAMYAPAEDFARLRSAMPDPEIMQGILWS